MSNIIGIINELKGIGSTNVKKEILEDYKDNQLWKDVVYYTYNSNFNFYIKKLPEITKNTGENDLITFIDLLQYIMDESIRGHSATDMVVACLEKLSEDDCDVAKMMLSRDFKCGCNISSFNKVYDNMIPTTPYMGCKGSDMEAIKRIIFRDGGIYEELKSDGRYVNVIMDKEIPELVSRQGKPTLLDGRLIEDIQKVHNAYGRAGVMCGELMLRGFDRITANGLIAKIITINEKLSSGDDKDYKNAMKKIDALCKLVKMTFEELQDKLFIEVWDIIPYENYLRGLDETPRVRRIENLKKVLSETLDNSTVIQTESYWCTTFEEVIERLKKRLADGYEGSICKSKNCEWKDGKKSEQFKLKVEVEVEMRIIGYRAGKVGTKYENTLGSLQLQSECGKVVCYASGIEEIAKNKDLSRDDFWNNKEYYMNSVVTIKINGLSINKEGKYNFYYPNYMKSRLGEKNKANTLEEIIQIELDVLGIKEVKED